MEIMKLVLKPSLEHMALAKIVISLWNQNVRALMAKCEFHGYRYFSNECQKVEERIMEDVSQLSLPQLLKDKVLGLIKPIGREILMWMEYNHKYLHVNLPADLCWTSQGTIDRKRTAEALVRNANLDISTRYRLACIYCLEDDIHKLWYSSTEDLKKSFLNVGFCFINYWSDYMVNRQLRYAYISYKDRFYQCAPHNKAAAEYFLTKLTPHEREKSLVEAAKRVKDADTLCFFISEMNEAQQIKIFRSKPYKVLQCFLQWPFQRFFIGIANRMWDFFPKSHYDIVLRDILHKVEDGYKDWNYQKLFREFWQKSPNALKSFITNTIDTNLLLSSLFTIKDKENIRLILKDTTFTVKSNLIYSYEMNTFCKQFIRDNEWDLLEFCIRECFPSKNDMLKFKGEFEKRMSPYFKEHFATKKHKWDKLFHLSDVSIFKYDKRRLEEGESSSSKRYRSLQ